jgi:diketogulonate reductase-like aldo/keto reductase
VYGDYPTILRIAEKYGKLPSQIVLRWNVQHEGSVAIPKSVTPERIRSNLDIFDFTLTQDEMEAIRALGSRDGRLIKPDFSPDWD